jgi:hypothetical protein
MGFKPKRIEEPEPEPARLTSAEIAASIGPLASNLIPTRPQPVPAPIPVPEEPRKRAEPSLMMSSKASKPFARMLANAAEPEGGLRRLIARVFSEAGYPVPEVDIKGSRQRRTYD